MSNSNDPYRSPSEAEAGGSSFESFEGWTNGRLVALFFLPVTILFAFFVLDLFYHRVLRMTVPDGYGELLGILLISAIIGVSIFAAFLNKDRQQAGWGTMILMTFVYLIAEIFSVFLAIAAIVVLA